MKLLQQGFAFRANVGARAFFHGGLLADPNHSARSALRFWQPAAAPFLFQTALPAVVAFPSGLFGKLKMESDDQFFRSSSANPHCPRSESTISRDSASGPFA